MIILKKNEGDANPECVFSNKSTIDKRKEEALESINPIKPMLQAYKSKISSSPDNTIQNFARATSFHVDEILQMIQQSPDCKYVRVYNGLTDTGEFVTYMAPIRDTFATYFEDPGLQTMMLQSCCHCKPCFSDPLMNP